MSIRFARLWGVILEQLIENQWLSRHRRWRGHRHGWLRQSDGCPAKDRNA
jgi:hypothetical protein